MADPELRPDGFPVGYQCALTLQTPQPGVFQRAPVWEINCEVARSMAVNFFVTCYPRGVDVGWPTWEDPDGD